MPFVLMRTACVCGMCMHIFQASEDSIPEGSKLTQLWSRTRALRLSELIVGQGLRTRGQDLMMLLGNAKDLFERYDDLPCAWFAGNKGHSNAACHERQSNAVCHRKAFRCHMSQMPSAMIAGNKRRIEMLHVMLVIRGPKDFQSHCRFICIKA